MQISQIISVVALMVSVTVAVRLNHCPDLHSKTKEYYGTSIICPNSDVFPFCFSVTQARTAAGQTGGLAEGNTKLATECAMIQHTCWISAATSVSPV